jgi:hypothetical protein
MTLDLKIMDLGKATPRLDIAPHTRARWGVEGKCPGGTK